MTRLTKRYRFCASHRLASCQLDERRNREVFGKCANPHGHGHDYRLEVTVGCRRTPATGLVLSRAELDEWVRAAVLDKVGHTHLNSDVPEFKRLVPTAENILLVIEGWLRDGWSERHPGTAPPLFALRLEETPRNSVRVEFAGPPAPS